MEGWALVAARRSQFVDGAKVGRSMLSSRIRVGAGGGEVGYVFEGQAWGLMLDEVLDHHLNRPRSVAAGFARLWPHLWGKVLSRV